MTVHVGFSMLQLLLFKYCVTSSALWASWL
jgi:hypothetical protein